MTRNTIPMRRLALAAGAALVACSSLSPNPPDPHQTTDPLPPFPLSVEALDASSDAAQDAP